MARRNERPCFSKSGDVRARTSPDFAEANFCLMAWRNKRSADDVDGLPDALVLSSQRHPVLRRQPLDDIEVSIPACVVYGLLPVLSSAVSDTPSCSASHLTTSRCSVKHAMWMGCLPILPSAVSDTPSRVASHLTTSSRLGIHLPAYWWVYVSVNASDCRGAHELFGHTLTHDT
jgi:hypothetical protein